MARRSSGVRTRQVYASIDEDLYLAAKARSSELRIPLREFIERGLELALGGRTPTAGDTGAGPWEEECFRLQADRPVGDPVELTREEAAQAAQAAFAIGRRIEGQS